VQRASVSTARPSRSQLDSGRRHRPSPPVGTLSPSLHCFDHLGRGIGRCCSTAHCANQAIGGYDFWQKRALAPRVSRGVDGTRAKRVLERAGVSAARGATTRAEMVWLALNARPGRVARVWKTASRVRHFILASCGHRSCVENPHLGRVFL
jgi:hypothetical protein